MSQAEPDALPKEGSSKASVLGPKTNYRWVVIGFAFFITLVNYMDRSAMAYAIGPLKNEFGFTDGAIGLIGSAFGIGYAVMTTGGGILVDRFGSRIVWSSAAILWSACTALMGVCSNFNIFFVVRTTLGLAEGPHFPSLTRVVADWLPKEERARSTAFGLAAVPLASAIGAPIIVALINAFSWKMMFAILGAVGIVWAAVWWLVYRDYPEHSKFVNDAELSYIREGAAINRELKMDEIKAHELTGDATTWKFILTNPALVANNFAFFGFGYLLFFAVHWLPEYYKRTYHLDLKQMVPYVVAPWITAAIMVVAAGFISDYLWKKTGSMRASRTHMMWICQLISGLCFIPIMFNPDLNTALILVCAGLGFGLMPNACYYAINTDLAKDKAATSLGVMDTYLALAGILAPLITGKLTEITGNFNSAFGILAFFTLAAVVAILVLMKPDDYVHV
jgi:ACS family hexuronate transporter-like MFS transporter